MKEIQKTKDREKTFSALLSEVKTLDEKWEIVSREAEKLINQKWKKEDQLNSDFDKLEKEIEKDKKDYIKMVDDLEKKIQKEIDKNTDIQKKVIDGKSSLQDLQDGYKHPREIRKEMRRKFREDIKPIMEALRTKSYNLWKIHKDRLWNRTMIDQTRMGRLNNLSFYLDERKKKVDFYRPSEFELEQTFMRFKEAEKWTKTVEIGAIPSTFPFLKIDSLEKLESLILNCVVQPEHEEELDDIIAQIKEEGFEWGHINVTYSPAQWGDQKGGFSFIKFWDDPMKGRALTIADIDNVGKEKRSLGRKKSPELGDLK